ncbi:MAG: 2-oxoacid:ferredoxin oxidoreductase subunit beta [Calditrichaeota bacterium]|nr:MAG: 2-oxoacid:ferredoxin oxidoreductase subunit beta [Calditrichota bacterium]
MIETLAQKEHKYTREDFSSDQEVRWCPGCGDYSILAQMKRILPELGVKKENIVFVSGIGCSSRFPYYVDTYGLHGIHGRAPALASGIKLANPDLTVFIITGDGDALSIGGNHFIHLCRRNIDVTVLLFNNRIYGLTKGQYSPTSERGKITKSSPYGSLEEPFNPVKLALAAGAGFVARSVDRDPKHLEAVLLEAAQYNGTSFVEIYQNCNIFNDGAFERFTNVKTKFDHVLYMNNDDAYRFGREHEKQLVWEDDRFSVKEWREKDADHAEVHQPETISDARAIALADMDGLDERPLPLGVFRKRDVETYDTLLTKQIEEVKKTKGQGDLKKLLHAGNTWQVK